MAALETPWLEQMSSTNHNQSDVGSSSTQESHDPPTFAAFSPHTGFTSVPANPRSVISIEKKTPLLISTPPQVTRALAQIYPYLLIANKLVGLLSWTTNDPWESFLALASFWAVVLYGDATLRYAGPLIAVVGLILCMYWRRFSPLSSSVWNEERRRRSQASKDLDDNTSHHKSLDHVIDTLKLFTLRCNILVDPLLELTNFLSTQQTAVSATTRPALTSLFIRIILLTPVWIVLTSPFVQFITTKRMVLTIGTISLTWHSAPAKVTRTILWRSRSVRQISAMVTGLRFSPVDDTSRKAEAVMLQTTRALKAQANTSKDGERGSAPQVIRFTFTLYENQRRWIGIGWTSSMLSYERASWTDDHLNPMPPKDEFHLPEVEGAGARWKWIEGVDWQLEGTELSSKNSASEQADKSHQEADAGWIYYDNKWRSGKRGVDGWGRYTRRRKWCRAAELVEIEQMAEKAQSDGDASAVSPVSPVSPTSPSVALESQPTTPRTAQEEPIDDNSGKSRRKRWFRRTSAGGSHESGKPGNVGSIEGYHEEAEDDAPSAVHIAPVDHGFGYGDDARMELG